MGYGESYGENYGGGTQVDFSDLNSATTWFETQTPETRSLMACRAALRVFANFRAELRGAPDHLDLSLLRCTLISARRAVGRPADMDWRSAARTAALSALSAARTALTWDASALNTLATSAVWEGAATPAVIVANHNKIVAAFTKDKVWRFWLRFYEGMWNGTFDEWDLALELIKIDEAIWTDGVEAVAAEIEKIEARLEFQARISELEQAVLDEHSQRRGIGGNYPPEPIDDIEIVPTELQPLWEPLLSIKAETRAEVPDVKRVQTAISVLIGVASACGSWTWGKANVFIDAGLKTAGAATGTALLAYLTGHGDKIALVINAALKWVRLLS